MKKLSLTFLILLFTLTSNVVWSADFEKGLTAYDSGDYATALREWTPQALYFLRKHETVRLNGEMTGIFLEKIDDGNYHWWLPLRAGEI